jgi:hypothetical protein
VQVHASGSARLQLERDNNTISNFLHLHIIEPIGTKSWSRWKKFGRWYPHIKSVAAAESLVITQR